MEDTAIKVAVIDEQIKGLREQQKAHAESTDKKFDKTFEYLKPIAEWVQENKNIPERVRDSEANIKTLQEYQNEQKGFFKASNFYATGIGGLIVATIDFLRH